MTIENKKILFIAPLISCSGYGEHARLVYEVLEKYRGAYTLDVLPTNWGQTSNDHSILDKYPLLASQLTLPDKVSQTPYEIIIQLGIPPEFNVNMNSRPRRLIGITAGIESDEVSPGWLNVANLDELCVVSEHAKKGFIRCARKNHSDNKPLLEWLEKNIQVIHYPVKYPKIEHNDKVLDPSDIDTDFNFLTVAQMGPRKDLPLLIQSFVEEFHDDPNVGLIIKGNLANNSGVDRHFARVELANILGPYPDRKCKIHHLHGNLSEAQVHSLYVDSRVNGYVTTTHGEGYGLPIFEAAYSGLPVLAPAWSGHVDFLYMPVKNEKSGKIKSSPMFTKIKYSLQKVNPAAHWKGVIEPHTHWCFVDRADLKKKMREFYNNTKTNKNSLLKKNAHQLKEYLHSVFTQQSIMEQYRDVIFRGINIEEETAATAEWNEYLSEMID